MRQRPWGLAGLLVFVLLAPPGCSSNPESRPTSAPSASPTTGATKDGNRFPGALVFVDGKVFDISTGRPREVAQFPAPYAPESPPVRVSGGFLGAVGSGGQTKLVLISEDGQRQDLATNVAGFAVDANGERVAWSHTENGGTRTVLFERRLAQDESTHELRYARFARVVGYAGDAVLLETGDGAEAAAAVWTAKRDRVMPIEGYGGTAATSPKTGVAALNQGDGTCLTLVSVQPGGRVEVLPTDPLPCESGMGAFDREGSWFVAPTESSLTITHLAERTTQPGWALDGKFVAVAWYLETEVLVLTSKDDKLLATSCSVAEGNCQLAGEFPVHRSSAWVVEAVRDSF